MAMPSGRTSRSSWTLSSSARTTSTSRCPSLIPESLLKKEGELVEGFAPEAAWVTMGGSEKLEERMALRPTSETMFCDHWSQRAAQLP